MTSHDNSVKVAAVSAVTGIAVGLIAFLNGASFASFVQLVVSFLETFATVGPQHPGFLVSLLAAFIVGLSMNVLPCNMPIVMTLIPATAGKPDRGAVLKTTGAYMVGGIAVLGLLGFVLGLFGSTLTPYVRAYGGFGLFTAGIVLGGIGVFSILVGLREFGLLSLPRISFPFTTALKQKAEQGEGVWKYIFIGAVYSGGSGGCPMPHYQLLLLWIVVSANPVYGAVLLSVYVVGRIVPVAVIGAGLQMRSEQVTEMLAEQYSGLKALNGLIFLVLGSFLVTFLGLRIVVTLV